MFCGEIPCSCNKPAKPAPKAKAKPKPAPEPVVTSTAPITSGPSPMEGGQYTTGIGRKAPKQLVPERDNVMTYAVECVLMSDMVHHEDASRLRRIYGVTRTPALITKVNDWRRRNGRGHTSPQA